MKNLLAWASAALLLACVVAWYATRDAASNRITAKKLAATSQPLPIDRRLLQSAHQMAVAADTADEQALAAEALRLADHEVDQAFASALREAAAASPLPAGGPLKALTDRIAQLKKSMALEQARIAKLTQDAAAKGSGDNAAELAKAQLALDEDELDDAQQDLARQGGDQHATLERALQEHEQAQHEAAQPAKPLASGSVATMSAQIGAWLSLRDRQRQLEAVRDQAANNAAKLEREHNALEELAANKPVAAQALAAAANADDADATEEEDPAAMLARLRHLSDQRKTLAELDKRIQDSQQLADVYKRWSAVVETRQRGVLHLLLGSLAAVLSILLAVILIDRGIRRAFERLADHKRLHQMRVIATIGVQFVGALLILLIIFGPPNQVTTVIGLATAGLTVALKDFIVAFFGWFTLMGRNGLRVGDWVEINGVGGEVIEIGLLRTVLLEMGNWATTGHPTGRRVAFVNNFAIEGHYFNFSTAGQWLWDELQVTLPTSGDPYQTAHQIRQAVERVTETDASAAEQDWERVTKQYGMRPFSAKPAVDLRPGVGGLNVIVRYITRAPQRSEVKSRLFEAIVSLLHKPASTNPI
ncbi:MAG TPA: mechanosensitive ion channel domain-containing protein [Bryobacteraceae bacterium]|nr:mechanosensitive ion channel domain-containing protein [Bryobacteraceae bacterium]